MIHKISSDCPTFKTIAFHEGLNIVLAERGKKASEKQTRNRAGKSSLVAIVNFLLGADVKAKEIFKRDALKEFRFSMAFDLGGKSTVVSRRGSPASPLEVEGDFSSWPKSPTQKDESYLITNDNWKLVLGKTIFGLPLKDTEVPYGPSARSMNNYFARRERSGGFHEPVKHSNKQSLVDQQVNVSYLLGLDWAVPYGWYEVREQEKATKALKKGLKDGALGDFVPKSSSLQAALILANEKIEKLRVQIESFEVSDEYSDVEREATVLSKRLSELTDENTLDRRYLTMLSEDQRIEKLVAPDDLKEVYEEAGVELPDVVLAHYDDVVAFHAAVTKNRKLYLESEAAATELRISDREKEKKKLDHRRATLMRVLREKGALAHFQNLQSELTKLETEAAQIDKKRELANTLESKSITNDIRRTKLNQRLREDHAEQADLIKAAIILFKDISAGLYEQDVSGTFSIEPSQNGPVFNIEIQGADSKGVNNMQIYCFDMMMALLNKRMGRGPGFLIHDSHLFDGVDERQVRKALEFGATLAEENGFQYIVAMNTDELPNGFDASQYEVNVRLSDKADTGGLFGFRFG